MSGDFKDTKFQKPWSSYLWTALDLETTGAYPLAYEICEIGLLQWQGGKAQGEYSSLLRPVKPIGPEVQKIHGISNEMVAQAPRIKDILASKVYPLLKDSLVVAHHAPFDLGFLAWELEKAQLPLPDSPILCSSLLARKCLPQSPNHRLQTLVQELGLESLQAHRALNDAKACLEVALHCLNHLKGHSALKHDSTSKGNSLKGNF